ncbi:MAG TPA: transglycosylase domain-containing protein [Clostridia bacterium]|jgi:membrane peptidoglycan carboxypeptidase|nr:transglycosylase domain-containing protein [Clostridia bacterium]HOK81481.1 transglycosylase domain-containing protein [Clostridia bacterium]HOL60781.1 transglycosylase domain-containing protein [Clostridia bacterium]HPO53356.1 transglycosylase domain-containing protein [Clostridia bacterium]
MKKKTPAKKVIRIIFISAGALILVVLLAGISAAFFITSGVNFAEGSLNESGANLVIYDSRGEQLDYASSVNVFTPYEEISRSVVDSFIAVEDKRFYKHKGLDYIRLTKAVINNARAGYYKEGGSTITQQLAKNALLSNEKTITRKLKEAKLAMQIEKRYSKEEILTIYLNTIYFGHGIYGITAAAERLFDKTPSEITLPEAAMLTGIVRNPKAYSPLNSPEKAKERMQIVLKVMLNEGYISESEYEKALEYEYIKPETERINYSYQNSSIEEAGRLLGISEKEVLTGNYKIYTYMDKTVQNLTEMAISSAEFMPENRCDFLVLVADNATGGVTGYAANFEYPLHSLRRMPGSTIKPVVAYAPALDSGYVSPATPILDEKADFGGYSPSNYGDSYLGWTTVRRALAASSNVVSVKLVHQLGVDYCSYFANSFGLPVEGEGLSLALGGVKNGVTPLELTSAYMAFAGGGTHQNAVFIKKIEDGDGKIIYSHTPNKNRVVSEETAYLITDMLIDTARTGTAKKLASLPFQVASKTGTVGAGENNTDAWNMSYTTNNTVCVWYGSLSNKPETLLAKNITGGSYPTLVTKYIHSNLPAPSDFTAPEGIVPLEIDSYATQMEHRLLAAGEYTPKKYRITELYDAKMGLPEVSTYFDSAIPNEISSEITEGSKIEIKFSLNPNFNYTLYKRDKNGETRLASYSGAENGSYIDEAPVTGINSYYLAVTDANGEFIGESPTTSVLYFMGFDLSF